MKFEGEHITIRTLRMSDAPYLFRWENDESIWSVSERTETLDLELIQDYIRGVRDVYLDKQLRFIIDLGEEPIGTIDLFNYDQLSGTAGVGILIGEQAQRGAGHASEALELLVDYAKSYLGLLHLYAHIPKGNEASQRLFKRAGFHQMEEDGPVLLFRLEMEEEE